MSATEQQPQGEAGTDAQQEPVLSQFSDDDQIPDAFATTTKTFEMKDPRSAPKKPKYGLRPKILHIYSILSVIYSLFSDHEKKTKIH